MSEAETPRAVIRAALLREARTELARGRRLRQGLWRDPGRTGWWSAEPGSAPWVKAVLWFGIALAGLGLAALAVIVV